jgi:hypothetical protein
MSLRNQSPERAPTDMLNTFPAGSNSSSFYTLKFEKKRVSEISPVPCEPRTRNGTISDLRIYAEALSRMPILNGPFRSLRIYSITFYTGVRILLPNTNSVSKILSIPSMPPRFPSAYRFSPGPSIDKPKEHSRCTSCMIMQAASLPFLY